MRDAHLPAYRKAGFRVAGLYDRDLDRARKLASDFGVEQIYSSLEAAAEQPVSTTVFDVAVPASSSLEVLRGLPDRAAVLVQKPMGETLKEARAILDLSRQKHLTAAVNFQLRFAPAMIKARELVEEGKIGELTDMEVRVTVYTPWHLWTFLEGAPRVEILYHSIHYVDLIRSFLGDPISVYARTLKHPLTAKLASTRTNIIMNYGDWVRANITANHGHNYGTRHQESYVKWEGTKGAIKVQMGVLIDYPKGQPDRFEWVEMVPGRAAEWRTVEVGGTWFPDAFIGSMRSVMDFADSRSNLLPTAVDDAYKTMAVVEAAYESDRSGGTRVSY